MVEALYTDGIAARQGAFSVDGAARMGDDSETAFAVEQARENGAVDQPWHRDSSTPEETPTQGLHRGTENRSPSSRLVPVLGLTHLVCPVVDELTPSPRSTRSRAW